MSEEANKSHQKHAKLARPGYGTFGRTELAILGTPCGNIQQLAGQLIQSLAGTWRVAYVDADHKGADAAQAAGEPVETALTKGAALEFTDKITFRRLDYNREFTPFQNRVLFNDQDLVLLNGNHFTGKSQIVVVDPAKPLDRKLDRLTDVRLILLRDALTTLPDYLVQHLPHLAEIPVMLLEETPRVEEFVLNFLNDRIPPLHGLVLSGGKSTRMRQDKGSLDYHGQPQREHLYRLLSPHCPVVAVSCNHEQAAELAGQLPVIEDRFLGLGPLGGILSAFQTAPDAAWLTVACDLPYLSAQTLHYLVQHRNPSKMATAFLDPQGEFPEPLITVWEPRSYPVLLQFLSQGYACPRKALLNADVELLEAPDVKELRNVNYPEEREEAVRELKG
jgi:molybdopterin-guanine dinucleotide biosynthesis protein A